MLRGAVEPCGVGKLTAPLPCCLWQSQHSQDAAAAAARSAAISRVCLHEQCLWLEHEHQNVISPLSATYPGPFGTHSASKNSPSRGKEYSPKIAPPLGLASAGADTWSSAHCSFVRRFQVYCPELSQPKIAAATSLLWEESRCFATFAQSNSSCCPAILCHPRTSPATALCGSQAGPLCPCCLHGTQWGREVRTCGWRRGPGESP